MFFESWQCCEWSIVIGAAVALVLLIVIAVLIAMLGRRRAQDDNLKTKSVVVPVVQDTYGGFGPPKNVYDFDAAERCQRTADEFRRQGRSYEDFLAQHGRDCFNRVDARLWPPSSRGPPAKPPPPPPRRIS